MTSPPPPKTLRPGLLLVLATAAAGYGAARLFPGPGSVTLAIVAGIVIGNLLHSRLERCGAGITFAEKKILPLAIALLGVQLDFRRLLELGPATFVIVLAVTAGAVLLSIGLGRLTGTSRMLSLLLGAGNGICGSSAIAAVGTAVDAPDEEMGLSIATVNLLGTVGIFLLPPLAAALNLSDARAGAWIGGSLQAVGQVVAAGYAAGDGVGPVAVLIKMGRVLMIGPMAILAGMWIRRKAQSGDPGEADADETSPQKSVLRIPPFILGFFAFSLMATFELLPGDSRAWIGTAGKLLLVYAMAGIGLRIRFATLRNQGPGTLLHGGIVALVQAGAVLGMVYLLF